MTLAPAVLLAENFYGWGHGGSHKHSILPISYVKEEAASDVRRDLPTGACYTSGSCPQSVV